MNDALQAMYYISFMCDAKEHNSEEENLQWQKANQNRLNQNFSSIANAIESLAARLDILEGGN